MGDQEFPRNEIVQMWQEIGCHPMFNFKCAYETMTRDISPFMRNEGMKFYRHIKVCLQRGDKNLY